jgi:hypothetical protein
MAVVAWQLGRSALVDWRTISIACISAFVLIRYKVNSIWLILAAGVLGLNRRALHRWLMTRKEPASAALVFELSVVALLAALATSARAGPPFRTDDPEPVEYRHSEIYLAWQGTSGHVARDTDGGSLPLLEFNYGIFPDVQLHVVAPFAYSSAPRGGTLRGYGDTEVGVKFRIVHEAKSLPQVGIFPLIELPTGDAARGLGSGQTQVFLPVWVQKSWGDWTSYGGVGWWRNPGAGQRNWTYSGWLAQRKITTRLTVGSELFHTSPSEVSASATSGYNVGVILDVTEAHHVLLSAGSNLSGARETHFYVAYQVTLGPPLHVSWRGH